MRLLALVVFLTIYTSVKVVILDETGTVVPPFPQFNPPSLAGFDSPGASCSGFVDCFEFIGNVIIWIGQALIFVGQLLIVLMIYILQVLIYIGRVTFQGIDEAPVIVNLILTIPIFAGIGLILYTMVRKGGTSA